VTQRPPRRDVFRTTAGLRWVIVGVTMLFAALLGIAFVTAVAFFVRRNYPREAITSVTWAKGSPVSLQLNGTTWAHLPNTGHSSQKIVGAIRAWLNEGGAPHGT